MKQSEKSDKVLHAFLYVEDSRPCLVFGNEPDAKDFIKAFPGSESYYNKLHVFLPKPFGLESVHGTKRGETAFIFHNHEQASQWLNQLAGYGIAYSGGTAPKRTVCVGGDGHDVGGEPIYPGVA